MNRLLALLGEVESGARGYVITGEPTFLATFDSGVKAVAEQQRALGLFFRDTEQRAALRALEPLIAERIALAESNVELRRVSGFEAARQQVESGAGRAAMDRIREQLDRMNARQRLLLEQRSATSRRETEASRLLSNLAMFLSGALLLAIFAALLRENRLRRRSESELDRFFTLSLDLLGIAGLDGYFKRLNPEFAKTLGYGMEELLARPFLDFVHPEDQAATLAEMEKLARGESTLRFENRYRCRDGSWKWLSWRVQPFPAEGLLYATARDIDFRKQSEQELQTANRRLELANVELESFSYSVSHDLRAPLRSIDGFSQVLLEDHAASLDASGKESLGRVRAAAQRMGLLIDDILQLSKVTRGELALQETDLSALAADVAEGLQRAEPERRVEVEVEPGLVAAVDPQLMRIVFENLLGNAFKFTRQQPEPRIRFGAERTDGKVVYSVEDNGAGFDMAYAGKLFAPFQRLHSPREFEGTGIGLAIVARILRRHGGEVRAVGAIGEGARISFTLGPVAAGAVPREAG